MTNIVINNQILDTYADYYFKLHPKARKKPIEKPIPPSLNQFIALKRMAQNTLKQKYKDFAIWLADYYNISNLHLTKCKMTYICYYSNKRRRDIDNLCIIPKLINDGFTVAGVWGDDNADNLLIVFNPIMIDRDNPRLEMELEEL